MTILFAAPTITAPGQTLTVKDSEHPEALINADTNMALRLRIVVPEQPLVPFSEYEIRVEIHNTGARIEVIYMPALTMLPTFSPEHTRPDVTDEFGPPMLFGRMSAKPEALNYVVPMGGDYYGRAYRWTAPTTGTVVFQATYQNRAAGPTRRLPAWCGELRAKSP